MEIKTNLMDSEKKNERLLTVFSVALLVCALFPLFLLSAYNHPVCWDDWNGFRELANSSSHFRYGQRFSTFFNFILSYPSMKDFSLDTMSKVLTVYRWWAIVYIVLFSASLFYFLFEINRNILKLSKNNFFLIFSAFFFLLLNFIDRSSGMFYCHLITSGYTGGLIFMFLFLGLILHFHFSDTLKDKILSSVFMFMVAFILAGYVEIFVLFEGYISFYLFLFVKNKTSGKRVFLYFGLFVFSVLVFCSFFTVNKGLIAAKYEAKPVATAMKADTAVVSSEPPKAEVKSDPQFMSLRQRIIPWCFYNFKFIKQEIKKILSFHNLPMLIFLFYLLEGTRLSSFNYSIKTILFFLFLYPVILLMSFSGCYSGLAWFTLYASVRNVFDVIFFFITLGFLYSIFKVLKPLFSVTLKLVYKPSSCDFTRSAAFSVLVLSVVFTSFVSGKYLVGTAWHDLLKGTAREYDRIQNENYEKLFSSADSFVELKYPGFPKSIVNLQGNYIKLDPTDDKLYASKEMVDFLKKKEIIYSRKGNPSEIYDYTRAPRQR